MQEVLKKIEERVLEFNPNRFSSLPSYLTHWINMEDKYSAGYYRWLWAAVSVLKPKTVVELGTYQGLSSILMLDSLSTTSTLTTVDLYRDNYTAENYSGKMNIIIGNSLTVLNSIPDKIDFLFIDTDHTKEQVEQEWAAYVPKMAPGGIVVFDDIHLNEGMTAFWNYLPTENKFDISEWHGSGFGVIFV